MEIAFYFFGGVNLMVEKTIKKSMRCSGVGLHTGRKVSVIFHPAPAGWGVVFLKKNK